MAHHVYAQEGVSILSEIVSTENKKAGKNLSVKSINTPKSVINAPAKNKKPLFLLKETLQTDPLNDAKNAQGISILSDIETVTIKSDVYVPSATSTNNTATPDSSINDKRLIKENNITAPDIPALENDINTISQADTVAEIESTKTSSEFISDQAEEKGVDIFTSVVETGDTSQKIILDKPIRYTEEAVEEGFDEPQAAPLLERSQKGLDLSEDQQDIQNARDDFYVGNLKRALQETYLTNPRIKAQRQIFETTGETFNQALAGWLPTISLNYNKGRRRNRLNDDWNYVDVEDQQANFDQPLFRGGETWFLMDQADSLTKANAAQLITATQEVMLNAITAYADVMRDREILELSIDNEAVLKDQLDSSQSRFRYGEATKTDVAQSESRLARALSDVEQARGNLAVSIARFEEIVRRKPSDNLAIIDDLPAIPDTLKEVVALAQLHNPRVLTADYTESAADDLVNINKARLLPDVTLRASTGRSEGTGFQGVDFDTDTVLINVNLPLYQGGAQYSRVRESKIQKSRRRFELLGVRNEIEQQAIGAWEGYRTAVSVIEAQDTAIEAAEIALDGVKQEQLYGARTVLEVLDAKQELFIARVNRTRSERNKIVSWYNILSITGQLSPQTLELDIETYNPDEEIKRVKYQFIGF